MNNNSTTSTGRQSFWIGILVFLFPFLSLINSYGISLSSYTFLIALPFFWSDARAALLRHWTDVRWVVLAFALNFLYAFLCFVVRDNSHASSLERPVRMFFSVSAMLLVLVARPPRKALWWGVIAGAVGGALFVAWQRLDMGIDRPGGMINAITFGDLSLCLGMVALASTLDSRGRRSDGLFPAVGALAGLLASILTGTRGGWFAFIFAAIVFARYARLMRGRLVGILLALSCALLLGVFAVPQTGVRERVAEGVTDVETYFHGDSVDTKVGIRLELWKGAWMLIRERPVFGMDYDSYQTQFERYAAQGKLDPVVVPMPHVHNDALQVLVTGGIVGFVLWAATLIAPLLFFVRVLGKDEQVSKDRCALAIAGMLVALSYIGFGFTEVIFYSVKGCVFYSLMVFLLMGLSLNAKENDGKERDGK